MFVDRRGDARYGFRASSRRGSTACESGCDSSQSEPVAPVVERVAELVVAGDGLEGPGLRVEAEVAVLDRDRPGVRDHRPRRIVPPLPDAAP